MGELVQVKTKAQQHDNSSAQQLHEVVSFLLIMTGITEPSVPVVILWTIPYSFKTMQRIVRGQEQLNTKMKTRLEMCCRRHLQRFGYPNLVFLLASLRSPCKDRQPAITFTFHLWVGLRNRVWPGDTHAHRTYRFAEL